MLQACKVNAAYDAYEFSSETRHWTAAQWSLCTGPMVDLMCSDLTFCQCFFSKETRKFMAGWTFCTRLPWAIPMWPTPTDRRTAFHQKGIKVIMLAALWREKNDHLLHLELDGGLQVKGLDVEVVRVTREGNFSACKKLHQYRYYSI